MRLIRYVNGKRTDKRGLKGGVFRSDIISAAINKGNKK